MTQLECVDASTPGHALELTAARHLGAFRPDTDAATAHLERRSREVVASVNEALEDLACELDGEE